LSQSVTWTHDLENQTQQEFGDWAESLSEGRSFFVSQKGYTGPLPDRARPGDIISLLLGGEVFYILRPKEENYALVGKCYVRGLMDGEAMEDLGRENYIETLTLV
jgi:hypothetical protein